MSEALFAAQQRAAAYGYVPAFQTIDWPDGASPPPIGEALVYQGRSYLISSTHLEYDEREWPPAVRRKVELLRFVKGEE